jgi:hypothetical protein
LSPGRVGPAGGLINPLRCDMELIPILSVTSLGVVGLYLMLAAFVAAARSPRFPDVPPGSSPPGVWPRRLMLAGAGLGVAFGILALLPGVLPWVDSPSGYADLLIGAAGGAAFATTVLQAWRSAPRRLTGGPKGG